jgi:uncharacterized membrane protein YhaH (DUF805 family)
MFLIRLLFSFKGRVNRGKFWPGMVILWSLFVGAMFFFTNYPSTYNNAAVIAVVILVMVLIYCHLAVLIKRFHDLAESRQADLLNWSYPIVLLGFVVIALGVLKGVPGANFYGPNPLRPEA